MSATTVMATAKKALFVIRLCVGGGNEGGTKGIGGDGGRSGDGTAGGAVLFTDDDAFAIPLSRDGRSRSFHSHPCRRAGAVCAPNSIQMP